MKRGNGEGTISPFRDGYQGQVRYTDPATGKRKRKPVYGKTPAEVRRKMREVRERLEDGLPAADSKVTLASWVGTWAKGPLEASKRKRATKDLYAGLVRNHLQGRLGEVMPLANVRPSHIENVLTAMATDGLSASTRRNLYAAARDLFAKAVREELITRSPMVGVDRPEAEVKEAAFLAVEEARALVAALAEDPLMADYVLLLLHTGFRRGEGLGLAWECVDLELAEVRVRKVLSRASDGLMLRTPKTATSVRTVDLTDTAAEVLRRRRRAQLEARMAAPAGTWADSGLVFTTPLGGPLDPRNVHRRFTAAVARAGLPKSVTIHTLRHSAASFLIASGVTLKEVQVILGHSSYAITADVYAHIAREAKREAVRKLGEALDGI